MNEWELRKLIAVAVKLAIPTRFIGDYTVACRPPGRHLQSNHGLELCQHRLAQAYYKQTVSSGRSLKKIRTSSAGGIDPRSSVLQRPKVYRHRTSE